MNFELDSFQIDAIESLYENLNVLVTAPTGAGKTIKGIVFRIVFFGTGKGLPSYLGQTNIVFIDSIELII